MVVPKRKRSVQLYHRRQRFLTDLCPDSTNESQNDSHEINHALSFNSRNGLVCYRDAQLALPYWLFVTRYIPQNFGILSDHLRHFNQSSGHFHIEYSCIMRRLEGDKVTPPVSRCTSGPLL